MSQLFPRPWILLAVVGFLVGFMPKFTYHQEMANDLILQDDSAEADTKMENIQQTDATNVSLPDDATTKGNFHIAEEDEVPMVLNRDNEQDSGSSVAQPRILRRRFCKGCKFCSRVPTPTTTPSTPTPTTSKMGQRQFLLERQFLHDEDIPPQRDDFFGAVTRKSTLNDVMNDLEKTLSFIKKNRKVLQGSRHNRPQNPRFRARGRTNNNNNKPHKWAFHNRPRDFEQEDVDRFE